MRADQSPELEFKLGAHPDFQLPDPPKALRPTEVNEVELTATYWDTPDLRLTRRGMSLRHRAAKDNSERGWTVKLSAPLDDKQLTSRTEVHLPGRAAQPPGAAIRLLRGVTLGASLEAMADIVTTRRQFDLLGDDDQVCARVMDDHVHATPRTGPPLDFREVEVEVVGSDTEMAKRYVRRLRRAGAEKPVAGSKIERVLKPLIPQSAPAKQRASVTVESLVRSITAEALKDLTRTDPLMRLGDGIEPVHQARVATRRLRSNLLIVASLLDPQWLDITARELKWLGDILGAVRDVDVLGLKFRTVLEDPDAASSATPKGTEQLLALVHSDRVAAGRQLTKALGSARYIALLDRLDQASSTAPLAEGVDAGEPALPMLRDHAVHAWERVSKAVKQVDSESSDLQLHRVRRRAKHARYTTQLAAPLVGKQATRLASALGDLQEALGELQDAAVAKQWLSRVVPVDASPSLARTTATLLAIQHSRLEAQRNAWRAVWKQAKRPKLRSWL